MIKYGHFRHRLDASNDPKLQSLVDDMGIAALGYWWSLVEIYGQHYNQKRDETEVEIHCRIIANSWRKRVDSCDKVLTKLQLSGMLVVTKTKNTYIIDMPNFLKYFGSYKKTNIESSLKKRKEKKRKEKKITSVENDTKPSQIITIWNHVVAEHNKLSKAKALNPRRTNSIKKIIGQFPEMREMQDWKNYFEKINTTPFLTGKNDRGWKADFDWVINENNLLKIVEGRYDNLVGRTSASQKENEMLSIKNPFAEGRNE